MADLDKDTLMVALQAVFESLNKFEQLLKSETLSDPENISELLFTYDEAYKVLCSVYLEEISKGTDLPSLEATIKPTLKND